MSNTESDGVIQSHRDTDIGLYKVTQRHTELYRVMKSHTGSHSVVKIHTVSYRVKHSQKPKYNAKHTWSYMVKVIQSYTES